MSGKYIIMFKPTASQESIDEFIKTVNDDGGEVTHRYDTLMKGFAASISPTTFAKFSSLQADPSSPIDSIEPDGEVTIQ